MVFVKSFVRIITLIFLFLSVPMISDAKTINVKYAGAKGDGKTDDTRAIRSTVSHLKSGDILYFPKGEYVISFEEDDAALIELNSIDAVTVEGRKVVIKVLPHKYPHYNVIRATNCNKLTFKNLTIIGDRKSHDYTTIAGTHEFGYGIFIIGNKRGEPVNALIRNCEISNMTGDAVVTKNGVSGGQITLINNVFHHCRRQGISVLDSDDILISKCYIHHIGSSDGIRGTAPMAGIDIEPASGTKEVNKVSIERCTIDYCDFTSIVGMTKSFYLKDSRIEDISLRVPSKEGVLEGEINNVQFISTSNRKHYYTMPNMTLKQCKITWLPKGETEAAEIWTSKLDHCSINGKCEFRNLRCRAEANNCKFSGVMLIHSDSKNLGEQKRNQYNDCHFLLYTAPKSPFESCSFRNCTSDDNYQPKVILKNSKTDRRFVKNMITQ